MKIISDDVLLEELKNRFLDNKKALQAMKIMNEQIEKLNIKLTESERLKTNFLSNIRNEINNPLTSILGMARRLSGPFEDENMRLVLARTIYNDAFELDFQLRNIFIAAELEAGEATFNRAQVDVCSLIQSVINSFSHKANEKKIEVEVVCGIDQEIVQTLPFSTDPEKLQVVIANLLANALEFNSAGKVRLEARSENKSLHISIADKGIGIPDEERKRLFERFHQLDEGSSKKHKGHGLGLSVTKAIIEMLGGKISLVSASGGGTLVQIDIPQSEQDGNEILSERGNEFLFKSENTY